MRLLVVGPASAAQRTDQRSAESGGPDRNRTPACVEQAADERNGVVVLGGGDLYLGGRTDAPVATRAARAACEGIIGYCSATWTRPESPTADHSARRPVRSAAGGVSASTGKPLSAASTINRGVTGRGVAVSTKST